MVRPTPRPDVTPPSVGTFLLYTQGQQIGYLPLNGTRLQKDAAKTLLSLHVKWISAVGGGGCVAFPVGATSQALLRCSGLGQGSPGGFLSCSPFAWA